MKYWDLHCSRLYVSYSENRCIANSTSSIEETDQTEYSEYNNAEYEDDSNSITNSINSFNNMMELDSRELLKTE